MMLSLTANLARSSWHLEGLGEAPVWFCSARCVTASCGLLLMLRRLLGAHRLPCILEALLCSRFCWPLLCWPQLCIGCRNDDLFCCSVVYTLLRNLCCRRDIRLCRRLMWSAGTCMSDTAL